MFIATKNTAAAKARISVSTANKISATGHDLQPAASTFHYHKLPPWNPT
jgi:hypothetical protein